MILNGLRTHFHMHTKDAQFPTTITIRQGASKTTGMAFQIKACPHLGTMLKYVLGLIVHIWAPYLEVSFRVDAIVHDFRIKKAKQVLGLNQTMPDISLNRRKTR